jgi:very-short-patch-repair endonuclease
MKGSIPHNKGKHSVDRKTRCRKCGGDISYSASYTSTTGLCRECYLEDLHRNRKGRTPNTKCEICGKSLYRRPWQLRERSFFHCANCRSEAIKRHPHVYKRIATEDFGNRFRSGTRRPPSTRVAQSRALKRKYRNDPDFRSRLAEINAKQCRGTRFTSLELPVYEFLLALGIPFTAQQLLNKRFTVDAYVPRERLAIEVDSEYWHSLEKTKKKDRAENAYLRKCGYGILRISEADISDGSYRKMITSYLFP